MSLFPATLLASLTSFQATDAQIRVTPKPQFSCEVRGTDGHILTFKGEIVGWAKHEKNDSGSVRIHAGAGAVLGGDYIAVARDRDLSLSNYLSNAKSPTRMKLVVEGKDAAVSVEVRSSAQGAKSQLYAGFCKGDFAGNGVI